MLCSARDQLSLAIPSWVIIADSLCCISTLYTLCKVVLKKRFLLLSYLGCTDTVALQYTLLKCVFLCSFYSLIGLCLSTSQVNK